MEEGKSNKSMNQNGISLSRQDVEKLSLILIPLEFGKYLTRRKKLTSVDVKKWSWKRSNE